MNRDPRSGGVLLDASDAVSEAVLVVDGPDHLSLSQNVCRILAMEKPLGYVVGAVVANLARAELAGRMGAGSRQVTRGSTRVLHFEELVCSLGGDALDRMAMEPAWARGPGDVSPEACRVVGSVVAVLVQRFQVRPEVIRRGLDVAATAALSGDAGVGMTPATARRRVGLFMAELPALRGAFDRGQARAFAGLLFGTERHPEWSLLAECARALRDGDAVRVSAWHARQARTVAARPGRVHRETGRQIALFPDPSGMARPRRMTA
ncbi:hypothetical protein M3F57_08015 [Brachybacterium muris]|uniref:hypothetical protein n=1 Tax=Brachybacterium muris TaxID=219301 RepID=UPI00223C4C19|nr:hypothetical protein [Brachybacterium muris]MCT2296080.1 hypothetical protein [Brachybacterium muris]